MTSHYSKHNIMTFQYFQLGDYEISLNCFYAENVQRKFKRRTELSRYDS